MPANLSPLHAATHVSPLTPDGYNSLSLVDPTPVRTPTGPYVASKLMGLASNAIGIAAGAVLAHQWGQLSASHGSHIIVPGAAVVGNIIDMVAKLKALVNHHVFGRPEFDFRLGCPASYACGIAALWMLLVKQGGDAERTGLLVAGMSLIGADALWATLSQSVKGNQMFSAALAALLGRTPVPAAQTQLGVQSPARTQV